MKRLVSFCVLFSTFFLICYGQGVRPLFNFCDKNVPEFQLPDQDEKIHTSSEFTGKWHILFFLSDSTNTFRDLRFLKEAYQWLVQNNVELLCISGDSLLEVKNRQERLQLPFKTLSDPNRTILNNVTNSVSPTTFFVDEMGIVRKIVTTPDAEHHALEILLFFIKQSTQQKTLATKTYPWGLCGEKAPNFKLNDELGQPRELSNFKGKSCILLFLPEGDDKLQLKHLLYLTEVYGWLQNYNVEILWISSCTRSLLKTMKDRFLIPFITLSDDQRGVSRQYDISSSMHETYTTLILDEAGIVREVITDLTAERHITKTLFFFMKKSVSA